MDNATLVIGGELIGKNLGLAYNTKRNSRVIIDIIYFLSINGTVEEYASVHETIIQRHTVRLIVGRYGA